MVRHSSRVPLLRAGVVLAACVGAFVFVDFWEYTAAMTMALAAGSFAVAAAGEPSSAALLQQPAPGVRSGSRSSFP